MDRGGASLSSNIYEFGDRTTSDVIIHLRNREARPEVFYCHSPILKEKSKFFAHKLSFSKIESPNDSSVCIELHCSNSDYDYHVKLLGLLYLSEDHLMDSLNTVKTALGVLLASIALCCDSISQSCIQYLEAVPWDEEEEEEILKIAPTLGPIARPILARIQPVDLNSVKNVFLSAIRFATTVNVSLFPFTDELKTSAQEQIEYLLLEDGDTPLIILDEDVQFEVKTVVSKLFSTFEIELSLLSSRFDESSEVAEKIILQKLTDIEWISCILPKMDLMKEFVLYWVHVSGNVLGIIDDQKYHSDLWGFKAKLVEVASKALEAVGYGNVIIPASLRLHLLKTWLNYVRKIKPILDSKSENDLSFSYKMDGDLCQNIEGAIISLLLALPSNDQADILTDWMNTDRLKFPDLSEAFEVWCYRTKISKRRLIKAAKTISNPTVSL